MRTLALFLLLLSACGTAQKRQDRDHDRQCGEFCAKIDACLGSEYSDESKTQLCELARCESGCRRNAHSPAGYFGPFQYAAKTWKSVCYPLFDKMGLESCKHSSKMQDICCSSACAADMIAQGGIRHWPVCGKR